jgi:hypothetical protein
MRLQEIQRSLEAFATRPFNVLANVATIVGLVATALSAARFDTRAIPLVYLCAASLYLIVRYVRQERWARYAEGVHAMERAHRRLKEITDRRLFGDLGREDAIYDIHESLSAFAEAFTLVTGTDCRATLKEVYAEESMVPRSGSGQLHLSKQLWVATMSRSDVDKARRVGEEAPDLVTENSDFQYVVTSRKPWHEGDLPKAWLAREYNNSHWDPELRTSRDFSYRSAIVWPIEVDRPVPKRRGAQREEPGDDVIGILCIDSARRHAFRPRADVPFGGSFAHALYPILNFDRE